MSFLEGRTSKAELFIIVAAVIAAAAGLYIIPKGVRDDKRMNLTAWIVDWDYEAGMQDFRNLRGKLSELQVFGAYFDDRDRLYFTKEFYSLAGELAYVRSISSDTRIYLTIINDRFDGSGKTVQKDSLMVSRLMASEETRKRHIDEIIAAVRNGGFDGVEIDYEKIPPERWKDYAAFCGQLYERTSELGILLRIVVEPGNDLSKSLLPAGPQYVIMAYNLYGYHSGPGPKADFEFIRKMASKLAELPGDNNYLAFATGGFDWSYDGKVTALNEKQAAQLAAEKNRRTQRDKSSGGVYFEYEDASGTGHTVWYADGDTLEGWIKLSKELGCYNIALWNLGGNLRQTLEKFVTGGL